VLGKLLLLLLLLLRGALFDAALQVGMHSHDSRTTLVLLECRRACTCCIADFNRSHNSINPAAYKDTEPAATQLVQRELPLSRNYVCMFTATDAALLLPCCTCCYSPLPREPASMTANEPAGADRTSAATAGLGY
jgi:hypothetical protein